MVEHVLVGSCSSNTLDAGLDLVQRLQQGFVGVEGFRQGGLEGFVVAAGEGDSARWRPAVNRSW